MTRVSFIGTNGKFWYYFGTRGRGCLKRLGLGRPEKPRKGLLKDAWKALYPRMGFFPEKCKGTGFYFSRRTEGPRP